MSQPICSNCKHHLVFQRDGSAICRHVERGNIRPYDWACIWEGEKPCEYYEKRKKGDATHIDHNKTQVKGGISI